MEWHFPPRIWIKIDGLEAVQKPEETVVGGSMGAVWRISMGKIWAKTNIVMMEFFGIFMQKIIGVLNQVL